MTGADVDGHRGTVWIASYMKSGNTWMRLMLMHLLSPQDRPWTPDQEISIGTGPLPRTWIEQASLIDTSLLTAAEQDLLRPRLCDAEGSSAAGRCYFKTHDAYRYNSVGEPIHGINPGQAALYLVRDPRDVAVSLARFWGFSLGRTVSFLNDPDADLQGIPRRFSQQIFQKTGDWSAHVASWLDQDRVPVLLIRYEDLRREPSVWLKRALDFLGVPVPAADVARAIELTAFERLQAAERVHGFTEQSRPGVPFFRRAEPGEGTRVLEPDLMDALQRAHGPMMDRLGYLGDGSSVRFEPPL